MTDVFMNRSALALLAILPLLLILFVTADIGRRRALDILLDNRMLKKLTDPGMNRKRWISQVLLLAAFGLMVLGLARPAWDKELVYQPKTSRDVVFVLDISQSMLAEDQPPSRLACAKNSILQCLGDLTAGRVGLVVFAGSTSIRCPLTRDFDFFRSTLDELAPTSVPIGGTRIGDALAKTVEKVLTDDDSEYRDIVLITDGENHEAMGTNAVAGLVECGARLIIIGLGSDSMGAEIPVKNEKDGTVSALIYRGEPVRTKQNSAVLEKLAGMVPYSIYLNVGTSPLDLADVYRTYIASSMRYSSEQVTGERPAEQYWRFLLAAMALVAASFLPWGRGNIVIQRGRSVLSLVVLFLVLTASPLAAESQARLFGKGLSAYEEGEYDSALENFHAAEQKKDNPAITYNLGTAYYRKGDYNSAFRYFTSAAEAADDEQISVIARYNAGNCLFNLAFSEESTGKEDTMSLLRQSILAFGSALEIDPKYEDALYNLSVASKALESIMKMPDKDVENKDGTEKRDVRKDEDPTQKSESSDNDAATRQPDNEDSEEEQESPNLVPEDILKEEKENKLKRSRKKHSGFSKVRKNW